MSELTEALQQFLDAIGEDIRQRLPSVTGKTRASITTTVEAKGAGVFESVVGRVEGAHYISVFETGRPPTRPNAPKGSPTLREAIAEWIEAKGIKFTYLTASGQLRTMNTKQMSWLIANKIHKEGNVLYRRLAGGITGLLNSANNQQRIDAFAEVFGKRAGDIILTQVLNFTVTPQQ